MAQGNVEADLGIEIQTEEKEGVLLVRKKDIKLETVKNLAAEEEEGLDPDLILETGEDQEEETQETEDQDQDHQDQDHQINENVEEAEMIVDLLLVTKEETIEACLDLRLTAKTAETDVLSEETQKTGSQLVNLGL